jgi:steroid 5-alpha reductase family enzyme
VQSTTSKTAGALVAISALAGAVAWAGSQGGVTLAGLPAFALCAGVAFGANWVAFVPSYIFQTERYFDLTGSLTYIALVVLALVSRGTLDPRTLLLALLAGTWALRLGSFLFARIRADGSDARFDTLKPDFGRLLLTWTLQGLWVFLTLSCALAAMTTAEAPSLGWLELVGTAVWLVGFSVEAAADQQKRRFRADPANRGRFITSGLWGWSRHPNYFGEIILWVGIALIALPALSGWQHATLISPIFVFVLLTRISGIPLLESRANKQWGDDSEYRAYQARTPVLLMRPPASA